MMSWAEQEVDMNGKIMFNFQIDRKFVVYFAEFFVL